MGALSGEVGHLHCPAETQDLERQIPEDQPDQDEGKNIQGKTYKAV